MTTPAIYADHFFETLNVPVPEYNERCGPTAPEILESRLGQQLVKWKRFGNTKELKPNKTINRKKGQMNPYSKTMLYSVSGIESVREAHMGCMFADCDFFCIYG